MPYATGVYKNNNTEVPDYVGCNDSVNTDDDLSLYNQELQDAISVFTPEVMRDSDYKAIIPLLAEMVSILDGDSNFISECYNVDSYDSEMTYKLMSLVDIDYPLAYDSDQLKLLIKNYTKIRKVRGEEKAVYMLLRILERSEEDLYEDDTDDTTITVSDDRVWHIRNTRIQDVEFATYMLSKVIQTGLKFEFSNGGEG